MRLRKSRHRKIEISRLGRWPGLIMDFVVTGGLFAIWVALVRSCGV